MTTETVPSQAPKRGLRPRVWAGMIVLVGAAIAAGFWWTGHRRRARLEDLAARHGVAANRYAEYAGAYKNASSGNGEVHIIFTTCYSAKWDGYTARVQKDLTSHFKDKAYVAEKAAHYERLRRRAEEAAASPMLPVDPDPPSP